MPTFTIDVLLAAGMAGAGAAIGWAFRGLFFKSHAVEQSSEQVNHVVASPAPSAPTPTLTTAIPTVAAANPVTQPAIDHSHEILAQLREIATRMQSEVGQHTSQIQEINDGLSESDAEESSGVFDAITKLMEANEKMQSQLRDAEDKLEEQEKEIESQSTAARTDALTKLANRRAFDDEMAAGFERFQSDGEPLSIMMIDVDHFKSFNDTHGHQAGDEVLRGVGRVLANAVQENDLALRYGGEEFAMIFKGATVQEVKERADQARAAIDQTNFHFEGKDLHVSASAGVAQFLSSDDVETVVKRADDALYASKEAGRNCGHWHDGENSIPLIEAVVEETQAASEIAEEPSPVEREVVATATTTEPARDPDTGLATREVFCQRVEECVAAQQETHETLSLVMLRVDNFDRFVANRGEETGKLIMKATQQFFKAIVRNAEHTARFDRDVFSVMLPGMAVGEAMNIAERLRHAIARCRLPIGENHLQFTVSMGVAETEAGEMTGQLIERCQETLETATACGPNSCFFHDGERPERADALAMSV